MLEFTPFNLKSKTVDSAAKLRKCLRKVSSKDDAKKFVAAMRTANTAIVAEMVLTLEAGNFDSARFVQLLNWFGYKSVWMADAKTVNEIYLRGVMSSWLPGHKMITTIQDTVKDTGGFTSDDLLKSDAT